MSAAVARRVALAAQGFAEPRPTSPPNRRHLSKVLSRTQLLQLDSVNVAVRAHYMPVFSRLGGYPLDLVDEAAWADSARRPRMLVEYWAHVASLIPVEDWPLLRGRMRRNADDPDSYFRGAHGNRALLADVLAVVKDEGPLGAGAIEDILGGAETPKPKRRGGWWHRSEVKHACEYLFATGELSVGTRRGFQR
ncbi:MAG TPA: crosslink repair DNA glycosylase YcaQ family protein, partial [Pseudonocardiaceae bacterium]|nr:crosslink repair DNA glycosylase YcaQ family protein [Pseudonocardiaceae bacterium]